MLPQARLLNHAIRAPDTLRCGASPLAGPDCPRSCDIADRRTNTLHDSLAPPAAGRSVGVTMSGISLSLPAIALQPVVPEGGV